MVRNIDEVIQRLRSERFEVWERNKKLGHYRVIDFSNGTIRGLFVEDGYFVIRNAKDEIIYSFGQRANIHEPTKRIFKEIFFENF